MLDSVFTEALRFEKSKEKRIKHEIELEDKTPFSVKQFRLSPDQQEGVAEWVIRWLKPD